MMRNFFGGFLLPLLLLLAAVHEWNLISLVNLLAFLFVQSTIPRNGLYHRRKDLVLWFIVIFSLLAVSAQVAFQTIWLVEGKEWGAASAWWVQLVGLASARSWRFSYIIYCLAVQLAVAFVTSFEIYGYKLGLVAWQGFCRGHFSSTLERLGSHLRVACCLLVPVVQLVVGISHPSWISLPFFVCSCVGLVDWSLTSNFLGLFRWWRSLLIYAGISIILLYIYQLPIKFPNMVQTMAEFIGFFRVSETSEWPEFALGLSLLVFFFMLSSVRRDLDEMDSIMSIPDRSLTEQLLPSRHSFFIRESSSGVRNTNVLLRGAVYRNFSINFFTYGFPVLLLALSFWSFNFASICAFGLLAYVGYILYAFPSLFHLYRLNGLLLVFILLWAASTYVFNVAFTFLNKKMRKDDMEVWETIGLWHYPIPGFFLLAQFCLGVLVAMGNLVNNSVFLYLSDEDVRSVNNYSSASEKDEEKENTVVLIVATIAWGLRKCSRAITLALIFLLAMKPGFMHAVYMVFFLVYLLSHKVNTKVRQSLILLCETHFALLYILQLNLISKILDQKGSVLMEILCQLGLLDRASPLDFCKIAALSLFCAIQNNGFKMLFSLSAILQNTPYPPYGFSILRAGLNKSVLLSVYASPNASDLSRSSSHEKWIATYLGAIGQKFLSTYRSCGTYIAFLTILLTVYLVNPNYIAFGYLFFLLFWITGRQLVEQTRRRLWFPLKVYAVSVFIFIYALSIFSTLENWLSKIIDLYPYLGYNPQCSLLKNVWESMAVLIVMQLYSYERRQSGKAKQMISSSLSEEQSALGFIRRLVIWHSDKILSVAVFYASLSPISAFGFVYLVGLVICLTFPKGSHFPSKLFLVYTGFVVTTEYVFQLWGKEAQMFPGQRHSQLAFFLGFRVFGSGFWGCESGLRGEVMVIVACILQYNVFHWLERMPSSLLNTDKWEEPCQLFVSSEETSLDSSIDTEESRSLLNSSARSMRQTVVTSNSWPSFGLDQETDSVSLAASGPDRNSRRYSLGSIWGSSKESHKWNKKRIHALKKERFEMQQSTLKIYVMFWMENVFNLLGLEINMIVLLLASFALLNAVSILYILSLAACVILSRGVIRKVWPIFFFTFASVLTVEYLAMWNNLLSLSHHGSSKRNIRCHDCWSNSRVYFDFCKKCWLGIIVDDPRMLISYYMVFIFASFKLRSDHLHRFTESHTYRQMILQRKNASVWRDLSFETKGLWTVLDYLRLYSYCHLLDIVLALILITGTLEYDILHLGYLGFALVFFRMRLEILKKKNKIFKFLRMYNFALIILSLAYQSPFFGDFSAGRCDKMDYIYEVIGFYKYDYGFRITSRSALVEIVIFMLVSMQSYIFRSREFDYVSRYLEAEQIGAIVREQEKKAAWKTAQLQHIRKSEEQKRQRNLQVEKMKAEMLNLQIQLHSMNAASNTGNPSCGTDGIRRRHKSSNMNKAETPDEEPETHKPDQNISTDSLFSFDSLLPDLHGNQMHDSSIDRRIDGTTLVEPIKVLPSGTQSEITELDERPLSSLPNSFRGEKWKGNSKENPLISAVQLIGDGVSQVQSLGNQAVTNIVSFLNIKKEESDSNEHSSNEDGVYEEIESQSKMGFERFDRISSAHSSTDKITGDTASLQIGKIFRHIWVQTRTNNDIVCYCCFVIVFLWNFSLMSMVYIAALFLYALCVNSGPSSFFWIIMLIYTEVNILLQYLYQIIIQHCGLSFHWPLLEKLGFPVDSIMSSFVISTFPLFLVYITTLLQSSITAKDGEWESLAKFKFFQRRKLYRDQSFRNSSWIMWAHQKILLPFKNFLEGIMRGFYRFCKALIQGAEAPPYFVQLSMEIDEWPDDGIQPERMESGVNCLLAAVHDLRCREKSLRSCHSASRIRVQSIEKSQENPNVALAVFEVVCASPLAGCPAKEWYKSLTPAADVASEINKARNMGLVEEIGFPYPIMSVIGGGKREIDLYAYIFGADLTVFFLVAIFYQTVIKHNSKFLDVYQLEDQFPKEFVFILMGIFFLIVLDRIIYLCSFAIAKFIFYLFNLVLFTYFITEYAWYMEPSHRQAGLLALRGIYLAKAVSFALQALQIRYGMPHKSTLYQQFLTSKVSQVNYLGFRLYRALPFLYELRCVLDWSCTTTSLTMYDWLKLEDIHGSLYLVKCDADLNRATHKQGEKQTKMTKFCNGLCLFFVLICVIWAPMLMYSSGNPTNIANPIKDVSVQIDVITSGGRLALYQTTLCTRTPWEDMDANLNLDPLGYLDAYNVKDIQLICCQSDASSAWLVPPVVQDRFIRSLYPKMWVIFSWVLTRDRPKGKEVVKYEVVFEYPEPWKVEAVLNGTSDSFRIHDIYLRYFRVTGSGDIRRLEQPGDEVSGDLSLNHGPLQWWSFRDINVTNMSGCEGLAGPMAIIVSEETPQGILGETLSKFSIWSLYLTFVLAVGRFIRLQCSDLRMRIPYENLPSCDRLIAICEDIYAARAEGELEVEEVLYWTLVKIYRSPHMLLEYTKPD